MKFMLLTYLDENRWASLSEAEQQQAMAKCAPHVQRLLEAGKFLGGAPLEPTTAAKTVSARTGRRVVTDGPFVETHEQLGGYTLIEAADMNEAVEIAAGFIDKTDMVSIEVRPVVHMEGLPAHAAAG